MDPFHARLARVCLDEVAGYGFCLAGGYAVQAHGFIEREGTTFARLAVTDPQTDVASRVELGVDWRAYPPAQLDIGPVLHEDDAVANKLCALVGRGAVRDYVDTDAIIRAQRHALAELMELAKQHDPGFDVEMFADALLAVERFSASAFEPYGLSPDAVNALVNRIVASGKQLRAEVSG